MWTAVFMTDSLEKSLQVMKILKEEGFLVKSENSKEDSTYIIFAPDFEADEIQNFIYQSDNINFFLGGNS